MSEPRPLSPAGGWYTGPTYRPQNVLLTNSLEIVEKILGMCTDACRPQAGAACAVLIIVVDCFLKAHTGALAHYFAHKYFVLLLTIFFSMLQIFILFSSY